MLVRNFYTHIYICIYAYTYTKGSPRNEAFRVSSSTDYWGTSSSNTLQHSATHCNTLRQIIEAPLRQIIVERDHIFVECSGTHTATHCNTLQHGATHCNILRQIIEEQLCQMIVKRDHMFGERSVTHTATHSKTLQHMSTHYSWTSSADDSQKWPHLRRMFSDTHCNTLQHTATHVSALLVHILGRW